MSLVIDPEFQALCPPLLPEERDQLEASLLAEGCREPLCVWLEQQDEVSCPSCETEVTTHWDEGRWVCDRCGYGVVPTVERLLDGHNRYTICQQHHLPFETQDIDLDTREKAINWIIANQLGRRNLTPEQKSYLRGKRYNLEKNPQGGDHKSTSHNEVLISEKLAGEYQVSSSTIQRDGDFAAAVDTLEAQVRQDIRETVLRRQEHGKGKATKKQATRAGKLVAAQEVAPHPFMRRPDWKAYQVMEAIEILGTIPAEAHQAINSLLDQPFIPPSDGLAILKNLQGVSAPALALICRLSASADPGDRADAKTLAAQKTPPPDPQAERAEYLIRKVEEVKKYQQKNWASQFPNEPWSPELEEITTQLSAVQDAWRTIAAQVNGRRAERIATYAATFTA